MLHCAGDRRGDRNCGKKSAMEAVDPTLPEGMIRKEQAKEAIVRKHLACNTSAFASLRPRKSSTLKFNPTFFGVPSPIHSAILAGC